MNTQFLWFVSRSKLDQTCEISQGIGFASGLEGPVPDLPEGNEPLWLKYAMAGYSGAKGAEAKAAVFDENRLIKKKFKDSPITQGILSHSLHSDCLLNKIASKIQSSLER